MVGPSATRQAAPAPIPAWNKDRCDNCSKPFLKTKPHKRFCSVQCQKEYHRHGAAFGPLKDKLTKLIEQRTREHARTSYDHMRVTLVKELPDDLAFREALAAAGFIHRSQLRRVLLRLRVLWSDRETARASNPTPKGIGREQTQ